MIEKIIELILALLPAFNISDLDKMNAEIDRIRREKHEKKLEFCKAIQDMDIPTLNRLASELFGDL